MPTKIKDLPKIDRPREKLVKYGPNKLTNSELLAIILGTGKKGQNVVELSKSILKKFGADNIINASIIDLKGVSGLGVAKSSEIVACFELGKRLLKGKKATFYMSAEDVFNELKEIRGLKKEHLYVFFLDVRHQEIKKELISVGTLTSVTAHPREIFEGAIINSASQILLAHNHPSNNPEPTPDDILLTNKIVSAGEILGIKVLDHVIVSKSSYSSFKKLGLI